MKRYPSQLAELAECSVLTQNKLTLYTHFAPEQLFVAGAAERISTTARDRERERYTKTALDYYVYTHMFVI